MTEEEIKQLCNELDSTWNRYHSYAALARVMSGKDGIDYISSGSSRKVYKVSDTKVLKLAKNDKGSVQNYTEADWALPKYGAFLTGTPFPIKTLSGSCQSYVIKLNRAISEQYWVLAGEIT